MKEILGMTLVGGLVVLGLMTMVALVHTMFKEPGGRW